MADMTALERQVGDEILRIVGPAHRVDDLAVYEAVIATNRQQGRGFAMPSALKFVVAGFIVALFGGFLVAGLLTTPQRGDVLPAAVTESPSPVTTEELLSGMVTDEVEPGVFHVLNDGVRDLAHLEGAVWGEDVVVDEAGAIWRVVGQERYFRLGVGEEWSGQDINQNALTDLLGPESATAAGLGLENEGWSGVYDGEDPVGLAVTPDGEAWLMGGRERPTVREEDLDQRQVFLHFDGDDWEVVPLPDGSDYVEPRDYLFDVAPDGTLWTSAGITEPPEGPGPGPQPHRTLTRYDGSGWTVFGEADGVRPWGCPPACGWDAPVTGVRVAPDGSVWVIATGPGDEGCGGLGRFDVESWASYLSDMCPASYDIAADGAVWVVTRELRVDGGAPRTDMYVITPEAVAASG